MSTYNLNDNVQESFEFVLGGFTYKMKYPTVEETESVQAVLKEAEKNNDTSKVLEQMYQFISSDDEKAPAIGEILKKQNIKVVQNFNEMIKTEFGGQ